MKKLSPFSGFVCLFVFYSYRLSFCLFQVNSLILHQEGHIDNLPFAASNNQFRELTQHVLVQAAKEEEV